MASEQASYDWERFIPNRSRWFLYAVAGLLGLLVAALIIAMLLLMRKASDPRYAWVVGNSMEPVLLGPSLDWKCSHCGLAVRFAKDSVNGETPFQCLNCNATAQIAKPEPGSADDATTARAEPVSRDGELNASGKKPVQRVKYWPWRELHKQRIGAGIATDFSTLVRGDLVVLQSDEHQLREVKRVVGFPGDTIEIRDGDIWCNEVQWKKPISLALQQAILLPVTQNQPTVTSTLNSLPYWQISSPETDWEPLERFPLELTGELASLSQSAIKDRVNSVDGSPSRAKSRSTSRLTLEHASYGMDNRYWRNVHDSHEIVPVNDLGVAVQLGQLSDDWEIRCRLQSANSSWEATVVSNGGELVVESPHTSDGDVAADAPPGFSVSELGIHATSIRIDSDDRAVWLVFAIIDGDGIVAFHDQELLRSATIPRNMAHESLKSIGQIQPPGSDLEPQFDIDSHAENWDEGMTLSEELRSNIAVELVCDVGNVEILNALAFRDVYYRGWQDAPEQRLEAAEGLLVLGDNVSLSDDSRHRWPDGLSLDQIVGVVDMNVSGVEFLLRQRSGLPRFVDKHPVEGSESQEPTR